MIRGTSSQFKFDLPNNFSDLQLVKIKFWQPGNNNAYLPIIKNLTCCCQGSNSKELSVTLNQEETMRFIDTSKAYVQLRACCDDGQPFASKEYRFTVYPLNDDEILGDVISTPSENSEIILDAGNI